MLRELLSKEKQTYIDSAMGKESGWVSKVLANKIGILLDDIELLLEVLGRKHVPKTDCTVDKEFAEAQSLILKKLAPWFREALFTEKEWCPGKQ